MPRFAVLVVLSMLSAFAQPPGRLGDHARRYLENLVRLNTTNPPGNETRAANYLKQVAAANGITAELLGEKPSRLNFIARIPATAGGSDDCPPAAAHGAQRRGPGGSARSGPCRRFPPHSATALSMDAERRTTKSLLAAELAVLVELKLRNVASEARRHSAF